LLRFAWFGENGEKLRKSSRYSKNHKDSYLIKDDEKSTTMALI
jgi:hypothetical protein